MRPRGKRGLRGGDLRSRGRRGQRPAPNMGGQGAKCATTLNIGDLGSALHRGGSAAQKGKDGGRRTWLQRTCHAGDGDDRKREIERTNPIWPDICPLQTMLSSRDLSRFGRVFGDLTTWPGRRKEATWKTRIAAGGPPVARTATTLRVPETCAEH
jgi:hypothetical protein